MIRRRGLPFAALVCATIAVAARARAQGGCTRLDTPRLGTGSLAGSEDLRRGAVFRCALHAGGPVRRMLLVGDSIGGEPAELRVLDGPHPQRFRLGTGNTRPPGGHRFFRTEDLNRDGWADLMVLVSWGVHGEEWYEVFRYVPGRGRFARDSILSAAGNIERIAGRPCVRVVANYVITLTSTEHCWRGGGWIRVRDERFEEAPTPGERVRTRRERRGGRMRVTAVDTVGRGSR